MKSRCFRVVVSLVAVALLAAACDGQGSRRDPSPTSTKTRATVEAPDVVDHESGPESPIAYGLQVPSGATQMGPLIRFRSQRLIGAYEPELEAAVAQRDAEALRKAEEKEREGTPQTPPAPTPDTRPSDDSFTLLDEPPRPDSTVSLMRIDGKPSDVVRRMIAQINAALPDADLVTDDLSEHCRATDRRITGCHVAERGLAEGDRDIRITMDVDPGNLRTRTSAPSDLTRPVMTVTVEYVGEPRKGQIGDESRDLEEIEEIEPGGDTSGLIWPSMDEDAPSTTELLKGWTAPTTATILLSGFRPKFAMVTTTRAVDADQIAEQYVLSRSPKGDVLKDVVEDLNEVSTTYSTETADGGIARATYVLSARGNYTALFSYPGPN